MDDGALCVQPPATGWGLETEKLQASSMFASGKAKQSHPCKCDSPMTTVSERCRQGTEEMENTPISLQKTILSTAET